MIGGVLPPDGAARVGPVHLPAGRRRYSDQDDGDQLVAWVTEQPMAEAGRAWLALSKVHPETGLAPVLLVGLPWTDFQGRRRPADFCFHEPADLALADQLPAREVLADGWPEDEDEDWLAVTAADRAPFGRQFPGLAPASGTRLAPAEMEQAIGSLPPAYLGVVAAQRPADVPALVGWRVFGSDGYGLEARSLQVAVVLRSWEERFGARLLRIGSDAILQVLVERPPRSLDAAQQIAAEHWAFADECAGLGLRDVPSIAEHLVNAPVWTFWWD